jgi:hypothetical protein
MTHVLGMHKLALQNTPISPKPLAPTSSPMMCSSAMRYLPQPAAVRNVRGQPAQQGLNWRVGSLLCLRWCALCRLDSDDDGSRQLTPGRVKALAFAWLALLTRCAACLVNACTAQCCLPAKLHGLQAAGLSLADIPKHGIIRTPGYVTDVASYHARRGGQSMHAGLGAGSSV